MSSFSLSQNFSLELPMLTTAQAQRHVSQFLYCSLTWVVAAVCRLAVPASVGGTRS